jgi:hypothetical protein
MATLIGVGLNFTPINPIKALYWSAVINGVVAVPVMVILMLMTAERRIMGEFTVKGWLRALGWISTAAMTGVRQRDGRDLAHIIGLKRAVIFLLTDAAPSGHHQEHGEPLRPVVGGRRVC